MYIKNLFHCYLGSEYNPNFYLQLSFYHQFSLFHVFRDDPGLLSWAEDLI